MSSTGGGSFQASLAAAGDAIAYKLSYAGLEGDITQSQIHFGQRGVNGAIVTFLCSNLGNGPAGTQACPPAPATIEGVIAADDIVASAAAQGIAAGEFAKVLRAIKSSITYANVHIEATSWDGTVELGDSPQVQVNVDPSGLAVREGTGGAKGLDDSDKQDIKQSITGDVLGSDTIAFQSTEADLDGARSRATSASRARASRSTSRSRSATTARSARR